MSKLRFDVVSLFPEAFKNFFNHGLIKKAFEEKIASIHIHNPRDHAMDNYRKVDDEPYGGGAGMVLKPEPYFSVFDQIPKLNKKRILLMTPQGRKISQPDFSRWSKEDQLILICGSYEGFDERIRSLADEEISIGDFVLTGGEIPAITLINGVVRLLPGTLGSAESLEEESHNEFLLEHPQYTRPAEFRGVKVPDVLLSGNHKLIREWRQKQRELRTQSRRPDLFELWKLDQLSFIKRSSLLKTEVNLRIGNGYDMHRLVSGRPLILGGVELNHPEGLGLDGHSDADVLTHAIMDAILGALSLGDIGKYFPPDDPKWKNADSLILLGHVMALIEKKGWQFQNIDSVIVAERPKLKPYIDLMKEKISKKIGLNIDDVGVKATTNEKLGAEGREEGICCHAVVLMKRNENS